MKKIVIVGSMIGVVLLSTIGLASGVSAATKPLVPVTKNPIINRSTISGISITKATVENNIDPVSKKDLADFLLLTVSNKSPKTAIGFEIFYTMTDSITKVSESYYQKLNGFTVKAGGTGTLYFDSKVSPGHFQENKFSIYRASANEVKFSILLSAKGFKIAKAVAVKSKGTGEVAGG